MRDAMLSLLAKEPAHGYELRQRLVKALGPAGGALNPGQVYVTLSRLERAGLVEVNEVEQPSHPDKRVYELTAAGRAHVARWFADVSWSKVAPVEFHLKLVAAAATGLADPVALVDAQRHELLRQLRQLQELARVEPADSDGALLLEGASLRLQADIRWLEACERRWVEAGSGSR
jgi:DNA-binding PadR family transcriptional regulator